VSEINAYLDRIGYHGRVEPTLDCLRRIHRGHALSIPYENIDVQLGAPLDRDIERIFDKLVVRRRGGWCYEMNGLLGWALTAIGFRVLPVAAGILRIERGDAAFGNHLILLVEIERRLHLADLGMGDGLREPIPLEPGAYRQGQLDFGLELMNDGYWRFHSHSFGYPPNHDFRVEPADETLLDARCQSLQTVPESVFVQNLICQLMRPEAVTCLTGRVLRQKEKSRTVKHLLSTPDELARTLATVFGIEGIDIASLWPKVLARHELLFGDTAIGEIDVRGM
jgi:N-hydroxyarylamine O-acetyltransferase